MIVEGEFSEINFVEWASKKSNLFYRIIVKFKCKWEELRKIEYFNSKKAIVIHDKIPDKYIVLKGVTLKDNQCEESEAHGDVRCDVTLRSKKIDLVHNKDELSKEMI